METTTGFRCLALKDLKQKFRNGEAPSGFLASLGLLVGELGYKIEERELSLRLKDLENFPNQEVFLALKGEHPVGMLHLSLYPTLIEGIVAEIMALVITESCKGCGLGKRLVDLAKARTREQGIDRVIVRSNSLRQESHGFYSHLGFTRKKTQHYYTIYLESF